MGYPIITHMGLNEFTDDTGRMKDIMSKDVNIHRFETKTVDGKPIYPVESGLVPHYTGHIPGKWACACSLGRVVDIIENYVHQFHLEDITDN